MLTAFRPSQITLRAFLDRQATEPFSYAEVGALAGEAIPPGYADDHHRALLGHGPEAWRLAKNAVRAWTMFRLDWIEVFPPAAPIEVGTIVAIVAHTFGLYTINPARVVGLIDEAGPVERFGFHYGSLPEHAEAGEERFMVERRHDDGDSVWYDLHGFSRPGRWFSKLAKPLTRGVQKRFAVDSQAAMARYVREGLAGEGP